MRLFFLSLGGWAFLMAGVSNDSDSFFYYLTLSWWAINHCAYNKSCIANRPGKYEYFPDLGWVEIPPF
jgi:hypothetical protein